MSLCVVRGSMPSGLEAHIPIEFATGHAIWGGYGTVPGGVPYRPFGGLPVHKYLPTKCDTLDRAVGLSRDRRLHKFMSYAIVQHGSYQSLAHVRWRPHLGVEGASVRHCDYGSYHPLQLATARMNWVSIRTRSKSYADAC